MKFNRIAFGSATALALFLSACEEKTSATSPSDSESLTAEEIVKNYKELPRITPEPVVVNPELSRLCRGVFEADVQRAQEEHGPHAYSAITIFMNELAKTAHRNGKFPYPEGSIIVKAKSRMPYRIPEDSLMTQLEDGVGGMIKRASGSSPDSGDWGVFLFGRSSQDRVWSDFQLCRLPRKRKQDRLGLRHVVSRPAAAVLRLLVEVWRFLATIKS